MGASRLSCDQVGSENTKTSALQKIKIRDCTCGPPEQSPFVKPHSPINGSVSPVKSDVWIAGFAGQTDLMAETHHCNGLVRAAVTVRDTSAKSSGPACP